MVESELFPALRYFGLRFYAYNPVSVQPYPGSVLGCSAETRDHHFSTCLLSQSSLISRPPVSDWLHTVSSQKLELGKGLERG